MCEKCLYKRNCQFLSKSRKGIVEGCTAFLSEDEYNAMIKKEAVKTCIKKFKKEIKDVGFTLGQFWEINCALESVLKEMVGEG